MSFWQGEPEDVMLIGGGKVYRDFLHKCDTCYITKTTENFRLTHGL